MPNLGERTKILQKQLSTNMRTDCQQCTIKTTQLQKNYTTTEIKHEITTMQCNKLNALGLQKFKQTSWYKRFFV